MLGFEPRSEAPQASRIIHCSGPGFFPVPVATPHGHSVWAGFPSAPRWVLYKRREVAETAGRATVYTARRSRAPGGGPGE